MGNRGEVGPILVLAPIGRDARVTAAILLEAGLVTEVVTEFGPPTKLADSAGLVVTEEAFERLDPQALYEWLDSQPPWSDYPIILLRTRNAAVTQATTAFVERLGQVTLLERPLHPITLVSAAKAMVRCRRRQREAEALLLERVQAADSVRESEARFRILADSTPALVWMADETGAMIYANRRHEETFGRALSSFLGRGWLDTVVAEDREQALACFEAAVAGQRALQMEYRVRDHEGVVRWLRCEAAPRLPNGKFAGHVGCSLDITDAKLAADQLERRVAERTSELAAANRQLVEEIAERERMEATLLKMQRLEAVGQLTAGVAHDFNNLLTVIVGNLGFLEQRASPRDRRRLEMMKIAADRGSTLTRQLLAFSRRQKLEPKVVDLNETVQQMTQLLRSTIGGTMELEVRLQDAPWRALVDPTQLEMIILNLAINARDAMDVGGRLTVRTKNVRLRRPRRRPEEPGPGEYVMVAVSDTGSGMPPDVLSRVFEPFFTTKEVGKGSGLGLSQVLGFVKQSGGGVSIQTRRGFGTTVKVYLPRARDPEPTAESAAAPGKTRRAAQSGTILVVDDDNLVRETTSRTLRDQGYRVVEAGSGGAALEIVSGHRRIDLMLVDFAMPGMNGAQVAKAAATKRPGLPVLFITGYADLAALQDVSDERIIAKPFDSEELLSRVAAALGAGYDAEGLIGELTAHSHDQDSASEGRV